MNQNGLIYIHGGKRVEIKTSNDRGSYDLGVSMKRISV